MAKVTVRRIGVLSLAKVQGVIMAAIGLVLGVLYGLIIMTFGAVMMSAGSRDAGAAAAGSVIGGLAMIVLFPIFYALIGFVMGAISAFIYNLAAGSIGGLEMELEQSADTLGFTSVPPPPPGQWTPGV